MDIKQDGQATWRRGWGWVLGHGFGFRIRIRIVLCEWVTFRRHFLAKAGSSGFDGHLSFIIYDKT